MKTDRHLSNFFLKVVSSEKCSVPRNDEHIFNDAICVCVKSNFLLLFCNPHGVHYHKFRRSISPADS